MTDRRTFLRFCASSGFSATVAEALWNQLEAGPPPPPAGAGAGQAAPRVTREMVRAAEALAGVSFTNAQRDLMLQTLDNYLGVYQTLGMVTIPNQVPPAVQFSPALPGRTYPASTRRGGSVPRPTLRRPQSDADIAFLQVAEQAELIRRRELTSTELTRIYLDRLRRHDPVLHCVVNYTEERAFRQAAQADREIAAGRIRGPLHGIPYGVKDMLAVEGYPTTWGAAIYRDRVIDQTATVVQRLDEAGAVLIAKLAMGELGLNDTWFGGMTRNPWRPRQGSTGSSAGPAVSTAAGLVGFAIGTETMGSIVTPATWNGITGLRPTFGRVSRFGSMTLCWSLDKIGPMARSVTDCAKVLEVISGADGKDPTAVGSRFGWDRVRPLSAIRVGYFKSAFDAPYGRERNQRALVRLRELGVRPVEVELPTDLPVNSVMIVRVEAAAALDELVRSGGLTQLVEQKENGWPNFIRAGRLVPAYEYLQANRIRTLLMERLDEIFQKVDVFLAPPFGVNQITNLTGHPCIVVPNGTTDDGLPASLSFIGRLYGESDMCTVARAWQELTGWHRRRPPGFTD